MAGKCSLRDSSFKEYPGSNTVIELIQALNLCLASRHYDRVDELVEESSRVCKGIKNEAIDNGDESTANICFVLGEYLEMMECISRFWKLADAKEYPDAWQALQSALLALHWLGRFLSEVHQPSVTVYERYLLNLEKAFPYGAFFSIEYIDKTPICSICGRSPFDSRCPHIAGELYLGELAYVEHTELVFVGGSIVQNPRDKHCVVTMEYDKDAVEKSAFRIIHYLTSIIEVPLRSFQIEESTRKLPRSEYDSCDENAPCPCQSGSSFGECCSNKEFVPNPHWRIITDEQLPSFWEEPSENRSLD